MQIVSRPLIPIVIILLAATVLLLLAAWIAFRRRNAPGATALTLLLAATAHWALFEALEKMLVSVPARVLCSQIEYFGIASVPPLLLIFILQYTQQTRWLTRRNFILLWILPILHVGMAFTNDWHHWLWRDIYLSQSTLPGLLVYEHGWWIWVFVAYSYLVIFLATSILLWSIARFPQLYRQQAFGLLLAIALPWLGNIIYLFDLIPLPGLDFTPVAFSLTGLVFTVTMFGFRLLDVVPVARSTVIDYMTDGVLVMDRRNRVVDINPAAVGMLGLAEEQVLDQRAGKILASYPSLLQCCLSDSETQADIHIRVGGGRDLDVRITLLRGRLGNSIGRVIVLRDVTERNKAEQQNRLQSTALDAAANGIVITDRQGIIEWVNPAFSHITAYTAEEAIGRRTDLLKSGVHDAAFYKTLWDTITSGNVWQGQMVNRRKDGSLYTEEQTIAPVRNPDGEITHFIAVKQDISERKALEQLRDDLTYTMVHDLRNPLASIGFALEMIKMQDVDLNLAKEQTDALDIALKNTTRMGRLVSSILDISRLEEGKMPLEYEAVHLASLVEEAIQLQAPLAARKSIRLQSDVPEDLPLAKVDADLVGRVLQNLIDNALKFTPQGGSINVRAQIEDEDGCLVVSISDSGPGLSQELKGRLFQKFAAGPSDERGTGLGLAFCRLAVEAHGGRIWVEDQAEPGATFSFTVPVAD
ncbi:MAG: PAS domain S-box protein [Anaerolineales bacterium]|nr:PAS domain S-box protein [Anaerolineales bacterium]